MKDYKEFTFGWLIFIFAVPIHLLLTVFYINDVGDSPIGFTGYLAISLTFIVLYLFFYGMTTKLTNNTLAVSFGIGLIRKTIPLKRIKAVYTVKSPWYYGWGIRMIPNGTLYNISGQDGVELKFNDTERIIRIGTWDSMNLKKEIEKRIV